jgi:predicted metal-dependent hydrolase
VSIEGRLIRVSGIPVEIVRKDIKNLHLGVYPPSGRVRVAVPPRLDDDAVRLAVVSRLGWIRRQQAAFAAQERQSEREMVTGESHYVFGRRYRLRVVEHPARASVRLKGTTSMVLQVPPGTDAGDRERALQEDENALG